MIDGNKRLGWMSTAVFLELNGVMVTHIPSADVYDFVIEYHRRQPRGRRDR